MARSYTTLPLTDDHGLPLINVAVEAYDASDDSLVETAYTGTAGTAAFTSLPDAANYYFIARWGNKTLRWTRDFTLPTKQMFTQVGAFYDSSGSAFAPLAALSSFSVAPLRDTNDYANINFRMPHDFNSLTSAYIVFIGRETDTGKGITTSSVYGAESEAYNAHTTTHSGATYTYNVTDNQIGQIDVSGLLGSIAPDDYVGIECLLWDGVDIDVVGVMIYYQ